MITRLGANEIVAGIGFDVAVAGIIGFILKDYYKSSGILRLPDVVQLPRIIIPGLDDVPVLGAIFLEQGPDYLVGLDLGAGQRLCRQPHADGTAAARRRRRAGSRRRAGA